MRETLNSTPPVASARARSCVRAEIEESGSVASVADPSEPEPSSPLSEGTKSSSVSAKADSSAAQSPVRMESMLTPRRAAWIETRGPLEASLKYFACGWR